MEMRVNATGIRRTNSKLDRMAANAGSAQPAFREISTLIAERNAAGWRRGPKLSPITVRIKASRGQPAERLVATGRMKRDLTDPARGVLKLTHDELRFGTRLWYARFAQTGTSTEPRRRPLKFTPKTRKESVTIILHHVVPGDAP